MENNEGKKAKELSKRRRILIVSLITILIFLIIGMTYAVWRYNFLGSANAITTDEISIRYLESEDTINLTNSLPISDKDGKAQGDTFDFEVKTRAKRDMDIFYDVILEKLEVDNGYTMLNDEDVKLYLTDYETDSELMLSKISDIATNDYVIYSDTNSHSSSNVEIRDKYKLRVWIDKDVDASSWDENTRLQYKFKINVKTSANNLDKSGANEPVLSENMLAVYYDETDEVWKKADYKNKNENYKWYDYNNQMWANSVTVSSTNRSTYLNAEPGTTIPMDDILTMQVWIPRYKYKIFNYNEDGTTYVPEQEIEVVFEGDKESTGDINCVDNIQGTSNGTASGTAPTSSEICKLKANNAVCTDSTCNGKYYTHPAFTFGSDELAGIWVGKFELTFPTRSVTTKPGITSAAYLSLSNYSNDLMAMNDINNIYGFATSDDTHVIKNMEWGAIAYLAMSRYGKQGNSMYTGANKEVYQNNSNGYITGSSSGMPSTNTTNTQCAYNDLIDRGSGAGSCGGGASTTGNVYGIYDMSGGVLEYVMANIVDSDGVTMITSDSGFTAYPNAKYYDKYSYSNSYTNRSITKLGDAIREVGISEESNWYGNFSNVARMLLSWFVRGGSVGSIDYGVFTSSNSAGDSFRGYWTTRLVISQNS